MIEVCGLRFCYPHCKNTLQEISFYFDRGDCLCLLGPNGSGKTTLLKCILQHFHPSAGEIWIDKRKMCTLSAKERAARIAYVPQFTRMAFAYTVREVIAMGRVSAQRLGSLMSKRDAQIVQEVMEELGIEGLADKSFTKLSGGEKQMVLFGRALAQQADYLILDEPTSALDYSNQVRVLQTIQRLSKAGLGIMLTTHSPDHAFLIGNRVILMREGKIVRQGLPQQVLQSDSLTQLYEVPICVTEAAVKTEECTARRPVCVPLLQTEGEKRI